MDGTGTGRRGLITGLSDERTDTADARWWPGPARVRRTDDTMLEAFYSDLDFQTAFGSLFEAPPTIGVYASSDWHQW